MDRSLDIAIVGGTVIDGSGSPPVRADVGVKDGEIVEIGNVSGVPAKETLAADGAVVTPGFIDAHGHSDYTLLVDGRAISQVSQGVTTEVIGNCGHGCEPLTNDVARFTGNMYGFDGSVEPTWRTTAEYFERLRDARPAINVFPLTPIGNVRRAAIAVPDGSQGPPTGAERTDMLRLVAEAMAAGSNGISFGLEYRQEASASFDELVEQSSVAGNLGGIVAIHTRDKDQRAFEAVEEAISIARASGAPVQVSHILPRRTSPAGTLDRIAEALASARASGMDIAFDIHTRTHGITNLSDCVSADVMAAGRYRTRQALSEPRWAREVEHGDSIIHRFASSGWERVQLFSSKYAPDAVGMSIAELAADERCRPWEAVRRLLAATAGDVHDVMVVCDSYDRADILETAALPGCLVGSDATSLCPDGPLGGAKFLGAYTWAAWLYSELTRAPGRMSAEQVVRKLSAEPAERFGLTDRGTVSVGKRADIAVFDSGNFGTAGSISNPNVLAHGMRHVLVNGSVTWRGGAFTGLSVGSVLRRTS